MADKQIRIGSMQDVHTYESGDYTESIHVPDPIRIDSPPGDPADSIRLEDLHTIGLQFPIAMDSMKSGLTRYPATRGLTNDNDRFRYNFMMGC